MKAKGNFKKVLVLMTMVLVLVVSAMPVAAATKNVALKSISLNSTNITLNVSATKQLSVKYNPTNTTVSKKVTWTTSNKNIATVSNGKITAKAPGTATITATVSGKKAICKVKVSEFVDVNACYTTLNTYRKNAKLGNLSRNTTLEKYAQTRAKELVKKFSHTRPNGTQGLKIIPGNLYKGENIAMGQKTCASVMKAWYNSTGHRANMLKKQFTKVGIAGYQYKGKIYWVQLFSS